MEDFKAFHHASFENVLSADKKRAICELPQHEHDSPYDQVLDLNKVSIRYGDCTILKDVDWTVHVGEKWALTGDNGSGKSTLSKKSIYRYHGRQKVNDRSKSY